MRKILLLLSLCVLSVSAWAATEGTFTLGSGQFVVAGSDNNYTATFTKLAAGDLASLTPAWDGGTAQTLNGVTKWVFSTGCSLNSSDIAQIQTGRNSNVWAPNYFDFANATISDADVETLIGNGSVYGIILPKGSSVTDEQLETSGSTYAVSSNWGALGFVVRLSEDGTAMYLSTASSEITTTAMGMAAQYLGNVTDFTINTNFTGNNTTAASTLSAFTGTSSAITKMTVKNGCIEGDVTFSSKAVKSLTMSNVGVQGALTLDNCENLTTVDLTNGSWATTLTINNCDSLDHVDLKACTVGSENRYNKNNKGMITLTNNKAMRYVILPHNYENYNGCDVTTGNTNLYAVIATAYLSDYVYDLNGNKLRNWNNTADSTVYRKDPATGKYLLTATYNMYKGGVPDDMMDIAQSMVYDHCTIFCREPIAGSGETTAVELYDADGNYVKTLDFGIILLSTDAKNGQRESDVEGINKFNARTIDISRTVYDKPWKVVANNDFVRYLILPDNMDAVLSQSVASGEEYQTLESRIQGCDNLIAAVSYCGDPDQGNGNSDTIKTIKGIMIAQKEPGHVAQMLDVKYHLYDDIVTEHEFFNASNIYNVVMVGEYNAADIMLNTSLMTKVDKNGHYINNGVTSDNQMPYTTRGWNDYTEFQQNEPGLRAWNNSASLKRIDLTRARFPQQNDMRIGQLMSIQTTLEEIYLPVAAVMDTLCDSCLINNRLTDLCIPANYKVIGNCATYCDGATLNHIFTTELADNGNGMPWRKLDANYNAESIIDMWRYADSTFVVSESDANKQKGGAITISENVTYIGVNAFNGIYVRDVYAMGAKAPECRFNAFSSVSYCGNNTYPSFSDNSDLTVAQDDYYMSGNGWIAFLHFPYEGDEKAYTDVTRWYRIPDTYGTTDGDGNLIYWPDQRNGERSEAQACAGITWQYWKDDRDGEEFKSVWGQQTGYCGVSGGFSDYMACNSVDSAFSLMQEKYAGDYAKWIDETQTATAVYDSIYVGWHQFLLAYPANYTTDEPQWNVSQYKTNDWYTICLPFDMTKSQLLAGFGKIENGENVYPELYALYGVQRNEGNGNITLKYSKDLVANNLQWNFEDTEKHYSTQVGADHYVEQTDDDPVILKSGYPYMIYLHMSDSIINGFNNGTITKRTMSYTTGEYTYGDKPYTNYFVIPTNSKDVEIDGQYLFVGTYNTGENDDLYVPQYAYYMAADATNGKHKFFYKDNEGDTLWSANTAIIGYNAGAETQTIESSIPGAGKVTTIVVTFTTAPADDELTATGSSEGTVHSEPKTLASIIANGVKGDTYTLSDDLEIVYNAGEYFVARDLKGTTVENETDVKDYVMEIAQLQKSDWVQYNWVKIYFDHSAGDNNSLQVGDVLTGITGVYTDATNPAITVTGSLTKGTSDAGNFAENNYVTTNFMTEGTSGIITGAEGDQFFFVAPKPCEFATIHWLVWDGEKFVVAAHAEKEKGGYDNEYSLPGSVTTVWDLMEQPTLTKDQGYKQFTGLITIVDNEDNSCKRQYSYETDSEKSETYIVIVVSTGNATGPALAPRRVASTGTASAHYAFHPTSAPEENPTAITEIVNGAQVVNVTYYNVAGLASNTPFDGVNIIVTTYDNGTQAVSKVIK